MTINHIGVCVPKSKFKATLDFYLAALGPLGYKVKMQPSEYAVGLGDSFAPDFWISAEGADKQGYTAGGTGHICFTGKSKTKVQRFHAAALKAGGKDNGQPGLRPELVFFYYAAFVTDPVGNNIEVMYMDFDKYWNVLYGVVGVGLAVGAGWAWNTGLLAGYLGA